jgi:hypothetical protein
VHDLSLAIIPHIEDPVLAGREQYACEDGDKHEEEGSNSTGIAQSAVDESIAV